MKKTILGAVAAVGLMAGAASSPALATGGHGGGANVGCAISLCKIGIGQINLRLWLSHFDADVKQWGWGNQQAVGVNQAIGNNAVAGAALNQAVTNNFGFGDNGDDGKDGHHNGGYNGGEWGSNGGNGGHHDRKDECDCLAGSDQDRMRGTSVDAAGSVVTVNQGANTVTGGAVAIAGSLALAH